MLTVHSNGEGESMIPASFRQQQRMAGIWKENKDAFLSEMTPRVGQEDAFKAIGQLIDGSRRIVILIGESRSGKSWMGSGYISDRLKDEYDKDAEKSAKYMTFFDLELSLRSAQTLGTMDRLFSELVGYPELFIDELGRGKWSEFTSTFFTNLLIRRYGEKRPTMVATNLNGSEIREMLDIALLERLKEEGSVVLVKK